MLRLTLIGGLLISFALLIQGIAGNRQQEIMPAAPIAENTQAAKPIGKPGFAFYPPVPVELPDLNEGYLFNTARVLTEEPEPEEENVEEAPSEPGIDIANVYYIGSVIGSERRIGIIAYQEETDHHHRIGAGRRPASRERTAGGSHEHLALGATFNGYLVTEVLPDRIVFEKDGISIEKSLLSQERLPTPPQLQAGERTQRRSPANLMRPDRSPRPISSPGQGSV
jgi:hypothetical protein